MEQRYAFNGLNLSWETLEGVVKHHGAIKTPRGICSAITEIDAELDLKLGDHPSAEAQLANLADDVAYLSNDFDDALRAGLFSIDDIRHLPQVGTALVEIEASHGALDLGRITHELVRRLISVFVEDMLAVSKAKLVALGASHPDDMQMTHRLSALEDMAADWRLCRYLFKNMWRHYKVNRSEQGKTVVTDLFAVLSEQIL